MRLRRPPALKPTDAVRVVAPAGPFDRASFEKGLAVLSERYRPHFGEGLFATHRYLAGDDTRRAVELQVALSAPTERAVFAARGGYGTMRVLPMLDFAKAQPRPVMGFSDLTALHLALQAQGWVSIHGPVLTQLGGQSPEVVARCFHLLESSEPAPPLTGSRCVVEGTAEGPLLGGNLSVLSRLLATAYLPDFRGAVLLLEDVGERPYRLDRMWTHLRLSGLLDVVSGVVLGAFTGCEEKDAGYTSADILDEMAKALGKPCAAGFPIGHGAVNQPVPLGARVQLDATQMQLHFLEPAVEASVA